MTTLLPPPGPSRADRRTDGATRDWRALARVATVMVVSALVACSARAPVLRQPDPKLLATTSTTSLGGTGAQFGTTAPSTADVVPRALDAGPDTMHGLVATPIGDPKVHTSPAAGSPSVSVAPNTSLGVPTVFAIVGAADAHWIEVLLPTRPNGATGWVERSTVQVSTTDRRVFVDLEQRRLTVRVAGVTLLSATVATGSVANPTPTGPTFITELLDTGTPNGTYGPYAFGLGLHSNTLSEFAGGDGQVGIHGTNAPNLIGQRVSHGCVRLNNDDLRRLVNLRLPLGTPVFVS